MIARQWFGKRVSPHIDGARFVSRAKAKYRIAVCRRTRARADLTRPNVIPGPPDSMAWLAAQVPNG
jgi:hypothetical protein